MLSFKSLLKDIKQTKRVCSHDQQGYLYQKCEIYVPELGVLVLGCDFTKPFPKLGNSWVQGQGFWCKGGGGVLKIFKN